MRARVHPHTTSPLFVLPTFTLRRDWSEVDLSNPDVVQDLRTHVAAHVQLHPDDVGELELLGLGLNLRGQLVTREEVEADAAAERAAIADQEEAEARRRAGKEARELERLQAAAEAAQEAVPANSPADLTMDDADAGRRR